MKELVTADWHLSDDPKQDYRFAGIEKLLNYAATWGADRVYVLGDLTDRKDRHSGRLVNRVTDLLTQWPFKINVLMGNHDYAESDAPFFQFLSHISDLFFISRPLRTYVHMPLTMLLPHTHSVLGWSTLETQWEGVKRIFCHQTFAGARNEQGMELDGIPLTTLPDVPIYSGDVHVPQKIGRLTYVGAPYPIDFGDSYQPRVLLFEDGVLTTSVKLEAPQKLVLKIDSTAGSLARELQRVRAGDMVRIEYTLQSGEYAEWSSIKAKLQEALQEVDAICDGVYPKTQQRRDRPVAVRHDPVSDEQYLRDYCRSKRMDEPTTKTGIDLLCAS